MPDFDPVIDHIEQITRQTFLHPHIAVAGGGSINTCYKLQSDTISYFLKTNQAHRAAMFEAEALGLQELASLASIRTPEVICYGHTQQYSYIVMEYIELGPMTNKTNQLMGEQLAQLHRHQQSYFGWSIDNTIGSTPQHNDRSHDWLSFLQKQRIGPQLEFIKQSGYSSQVYDKGCQLNEKLATFFSNYQPQPSLLHGDLWSGNAAADQVGNPIIFDPACYYGDREADIAMTELFGGFNQQFYRAYNAEFPLDQGYKTRKTLYNLYHILNHVNLFGGSYLSQASHMIDQLLAET